MCAAEGAGKAGDELFRGVNRPADMDNMTDLEKKHYPIISAPDQVKAGECFEVVVEVGKLLEHPNQRAHFIEFVELYADDVYLGRQDYTAETTCPVAKFCVQLTQPFGELRAFDYCNLHGTWSATKAIAVAS
jgi:superoxide reductase